MIAKLRSGLDDFRSKSSAGKIVILLPYIAVVLLLVRMIELYRICGGNMLKAINHMEYLYQGGIHTSITDLLIGVPIGVFIVNHWKASLKLNRKNTRQGEEYGSARWGTAEDIKPFIDPDEFYNIILSKTERLTMNPKMKIFKHNRNKHVLVYGGSGSGKTFGFVKPNLYQMHSSYVLTDPNGSL